MDANIGEFCDINKRQRTLGEKEQDFLKALQSFYDSGAPVMSNEEFDVLKQELLWEGSQVAILTKDEQARSTTHSSLHLYRSLCSVRSPAALPGGNHGIRQGHSGAF